MDFKNFIFEKNDGIRLPLAMMQELANKNIDRDDASVHVMIGSTGEDGTKGPNYVEALLIRKFNNTDKADINSLLQDPNFLNYTIADLICKLPEYVIDIFGEKIHRFEHYANHLNYLKDNNDIPDYYKPMIAGYNALMEAIENPNNIIQDLSDNKQLHLQSNTVNDSSLYY